jgi:acetyl esterase/lipase
MIQRLLSKLPRIIGILRLILITYLFLFSLLVIIPLWWVEGGYYNLSAIEDGGKLCFFSLFIFILPGRKHLPLRKISQWFPAISFLLFLYPAISSAIEFSHLAKTDNSETQNSFSWKHWILGNKTSLEKEEIEIKTIDGQTLHALSFIKSENRTKRNVVLVLHGGSFSAGSAIHGVSLAAALAERGWYTMSIEYRLAPKANYPAQVEDVKLWIDYLRKNSNRLLIDTTNIFLAGESAGGTIALNAAYTLKDSAISAVANLYGITSMESQNEELFESSIDIKQILDDYRGTNTLKSISPIDQSKVHAIPTISIHGKCDKIVHWKHAQELANSLNAHKIDNQLVLLSWSPHIFNHPATGPSGQITTEYIDRFFRKQLNKK